MGETGQQPRFESDLERRVRGVEKQCNDLEKRLNQKDTQDALQAERIHELNNLKDSLSEMSKSFQEFKVDFVRMKTQLSLIAGLPSALLIFWELYRGLSGK